MRRTIWAVLLVAMVGCATGGRRMATVTTALSPRRECSWEKEQGRYHTTRYFQIDDIPETGLSANTEALLMSTFTIASIEDVTATVVMVPVGRTVRSMDATATGGHRSEISVEYEGHYCGNDAEVVGYVRDYPIYSTNSQKTVVDLDGYGIGAKNEGMNRNTGQCEHVYIVNLSAISATDIRGYWTIIRELAENGAVNEDFYAILRGGLCNYWDEGIFLYLGAEVTRNRDETFTIAHHFRVDATNYHKPKWYYNTKTTPEVIVDGGKTYQRSRIETIGVEVSGKIYPIAGTDIATKFADLGL